MRKRFFLGLLVVIALIWGPLWLWSRPDAVEPGLDAALRLSLIGGMALGGYLLWGIVMRAVLGRDDE